jgi:protein phosphatase/protein phosphatase PTC1
MEDVHVTYAPEKWGCKDAEMTFIGVYDGHGGRDTVDFLEEKLHVSIADELNMTQDGASTQEKLERAVLMTDAECRMAGIESSGATVVVCLVKVSPLL